MGFSIGENAPLVLIVLGLIFLIFFLRRGQSIERARPEVIHGLLSEVRLNQALVETFGRRQKPKKLEVVNWKMNNTRLGFLSQSLRGTLSEAFSMVEDVNRQIDASKKHKSDGYISSINIDKLREPLAKSREGLEEWLLAHTGRKDLPLKYPNFFDSLFGTGR